MANISVDLCRHNNQWYHLHPELVEQNDEVCVRAYLSNQLGKQDTNNRCHNHSCCCLLVVLCIWNIAGELLQLVNVRAAMKF